MSRTIFHISLLFIFAYFLSSCKEEQTLFELRNDAGLKFENNLSYTEEFNPYTYRNFYNGAGVAIGDINNDGLLDVYFTGNLVDNKLFLNKGDWKFEDITEQTGLACKNVWSSGANFVDINGDGLLDLYVCKAGKPEGERRHNELFINKGNLQFEEQSKAYGLDIKGLSIQSAFFDYDRDGDLDCYLLNNSIKAIGAFDLVKDKRNTPSPDGNKFLENRDGVFYDITSEAGIFSSAIGFGLGITLSDFNLDGWTDIYISNDYFEKDYLYINNQNKGFEEQGESYFNAFPLGAMGADVADLDNDLNPDLMITEMLPSTLERKKTKATYESWKKYSLAVNQGYAHQQPRNMLQRNLGSSGFVELGRKAGVDATDWSWSSLLQDYDNDGKKDIIVTNGIYKDLLDRDYLAFMANDTRVKQLIDKGGDAIKTLIDSMPSKAIINRAFKNTGDFTFEDVSELWGFDQTSFSNGCAYGDLDNDGDLDLVINNVNMPSFIYENTSSGNSFIKIRLQGKKKNTKAIGTKLIVHACGTSYMTEQFPSRGFQSSVPNELHIGLGKCAAIEKIEIHWPDGTLSTINKANIKSTIIIKEEEQDKETSNRAAYIKTQTFTFQDSLPFTHKESKFNQFNRERLLFKMNSAEGPSISIADCNADGIDDIFIGGAKNQSSTLLISQGDQFIESKIPFESKKRSEVVDSKFFDMDQDGDLDLYVAHGGSAFSPFAKELDDQIYENTGAGNFVLNEKLINFSKPISTGSIAIADYNQDGFPDIFVGEKASNKNYGSFGSGYLYQNKEGKSFELIEVPEFENLGMITAAAWIDVDDNAQSDLLIVGEWMPMLLFVNTGDGFEEQSAKYKMDGSQGVYHSILVDDINMDGRQDIFLGNQGNNSTLSTDHKLYINDFDKNGRVESILAQEIDGIDYPVLDMDELVSQFPFLRKKYVYYKDYAQASMQKLFPSDILNSSKILNLHNLKSMLLIQSDNGFDNIKLPEEIQYSSIHAALTHDFDKDGKKEIVLGGNQYLVKPQFGREDASTGWYLKEEKLNNKTHYSVQALNIDGQIRSLNRINTNDLIVGRNNATLLRYKFDQSKK